MASGALPVIYVSGSNYEIGLQIGTTFRSLIQSALLRHQGLRNQILPYYATNDGDQVYNDFLRVGEEFLPHYVDEIRGMAKGSHTPFHQLFLLHLEPEIQAIVSGCEVVKPTGGCSTAHLLTDREALIAHIEDACPEWRDLGYIIHAHIRPTERNGYTEERFLAFTYPGSLPGCAYAINRHGLAIVGNDVQSKTVYTKGRIARRLLGRALITAKNVKNAIHIIKKSPGMAVGYNYNFGQKVGKTPSKNILKKKVTFAASVPDDPESSNGEADSSDESKDNSDDSFDDDNKMSFSEESTEKEEQCKEEEQIKDIQGVKNGAENLVGGSGDKIMEITHDIEEDVRVEILEINDKTFSKLTDLSEFEDIIKKHFLENMNANKNVYKPEKEVIRRDYVQEIYHSRGIFEDEIKPEIAYPLHAVYKGNFGDCAEKETDSSSSSEEESSDSDTSGDDEAKQEKEKKKKNKNDSDKSSDEESSLESGDERSDGISEELNKTEITEVVKDTDTGKNKIELDESNTSDSDSNNETMQLEKDENIAEKSISNGEELSTSHITVQTEVEEDLSKNICDPNLSAPSNESNKKESESESDSELDSQSSDSESDVPEKKQQGETCEQALSEETNYLNEVTESEFKEYVHDDLTAEVRHQPIHIVPGDTAKVDEKPSNEDKEQSQSDTDSELSEIEEGEQFRFYSLEVAGNEAGTRIDKKNIKGFDFYTNKYKRLDVGIEGGPHVKSSLARENRVAELITEKFPKSLDDILSLMGDTANPRLPIWRNGRFPDTLATMTLGVFNFNTEEMIVFRENPRSNPTYAAFQFPK